MVYSTFIIYKNQIVRAHRILIYVKKTWFLSFFRIKKLPVFVNSRTFASSKGTKEIFERIGIEQKNNLDILQFHIGF